MKSKELHEWRWRSFEKLLAYVCQQKKPKRVLEWGPGKSTKVILANAPDAQVLTIEHNEKWFRKAQKQFSSHPNVEIQHRVLSMKGGRSTGYINYPIWRAMDEGGDMRRYDLIFVDGRNRFDCLIAAKLLLRPGGVVVLHDSHRDNYMPAVKSFANYKVYGDFRTAVMSDDSIEFMGGFDEQDSPLLSKVMSHGDTIDDLKARFVSGEPFTYLRFGDADLFFIEDPHFDKNRRHDRNPTMAKELAKAFSIEHPEYLIGCVAGGKVFSTKDPKLCSIAEKYHVGKTYHSAVALQVLYMKDPEGFVTFCKECFWGRRVLFIGGRSVARDLLVRKAFNVTAAIEFTDRNAFNLLEGKMTQIEKNVPKFDVIVSALGQATRILGYRLHEAGLKTQYFDVGSVVDALSGRELRSWITRTRDLRAKYEKAFLS